MDDLAVQIAMQAMAVRHPDAPGRELLPTRLMRSCVQVLPVAGAGVSYFGGFRHRIPIGSSDDTAAAAERLQFTVGDGPCITAHVENRAVMASAGTMATRWPIFHLELLAQTPYRAILSLPIDIMGAQEAAAVDFYYEDPEPFITTDQLDDIETVGDVIGALLGRDTNSGDPAESGLPGQNGAAALARSEVWIAMGLVNVALGLGPVDSLATLRSYAFSHDETVDELARKIGDREIRVDALRD